MKLIISPYSQKLRGKDTENPKNYPYWPELIEFLRPGNDIYQIGLTGEEPLVENLIFDLSMPKLKEFIKDMDIFVSVDNFFPHFAHHYGKHGIVLWGRSDPEIFGYKDNLNLYKDPKYLRPDQFQIWEACDRIPEAFVEPELVLEAINNI